MIRKQTSCRDNGVIASHEINTIIAKRGLLHTIGESVILLFVSVVMSTMLNKNSREITNKLYLSKNSVFRHIDEMSIDIEK